VSGRWGEVSTPRQTQVRDLLADGASRQDIAERLGLAPATVRRHADAIRNRCPEWTDHLSPAPLRRRRSSLVEVRPQYYLARDPDFSLPAQRRCLYPGEVWQRWHRSYGGEA
jgi:hypothetical protein